MIGSAGKHDLHVLMTTDAIGGVWQYSVDLAKELRARGAAITLAVVGPPPKPDQKAVAADLDIVVTGLPLDWTADTREQVLDAGRALGQLAERLRPDIIHLNSPALAASAIFTAPVVGVCHSCVATWWEAVRSDPLPESFIWRSDLTGQGYEAADLLLAPSASFAEATAQFYDLATPPLVIHNGRRAPEINPIESPLSRRVYGGAVVGRGEKPRDGGSRCGAHLDAHLGSWTLVRAQWRKGGISSPSSHWEHERARDRTTVEPQAYLHLDSAL